MSQFKKEAENILQSASEPDAIAQAMPGEETAAPQAEKRGRGRPPGTSKAKKKLEVKRSSADYFSSARAINGVVFGLTCAFTGTGEAWPDDAKAEIMDKALSRYLELKGVMAPAEVLLFEAYAKYVADVATKPAVKQNLAARFGFLKKMKTIQTTQGWLAKFKKPKTEKETIN